MYLLLLATIICTSIFEGDAFSCCLPETLTTTQEAKYHHLDLVEKITASYTEGKVLKILPGFDLLLDLNDKVKYKFHKDGTCEKSELEPFLFMLECIPDGSKIVPNPEKHSGKGIKTWRYSLGKDEQVWTFDSNCKPLMAGEKKAHWKDFIYFEWNSISTEIDPAVLERDVSNCKLKTEE